MAAVIRARVALAAALVLAALVLAPGSDAMEVQATETVLFPVLLRGHPYFVGVTYASTYEVSAPHGEEKEAERGDDRIEMPSFVALFDDGPKASDKNATEGGAYTEDVITVVVDDDVDEAEGSVKAGKVLGEGAAGTMDYLDDDAEALADGIDLYWLQDQIDLLSRFETSLSLDTVLQESLGQGYLHKNCNRRRAGREEAEEEEASFWAAAEAEEWERIREWEGADATQSEVVFHPDAVQGGAAASGGSAKAGGSRPSEESNLGFIVLSIVIICLYCVVIFGAIYMTVLLVQGVLTCLWNSCCGGGGAEEDGYEALASEDEEGEEEAAAGEAEREVARVAGCEADPEAAAPGVVVVVHENPLAKQ